MAVTRESLLEAIKFLMGGNPAFQAGQKVGTTVRENAPKPVQEVLESVNEKIEDVNQAVGSAASQVGSAVGSGLSKAGSAIGSALGGVGSGLGEVLGGKPGERLTFERFDPEQAQALSQLLSFGLRGLEPGALERKARTGFYQQTVPTLAERFTSLGQGSQQSSGFAQALGQAGANLETDIAALQSQRALQALGLGLTPKFESLYRRRQPGLLESAGAGVLRSLPLLLGLGG